MSRTTHRGAAFLQGLNVQPEEKHVTVRVSEAPAPKVPRVASRNGLKHIGGYFDRADVEKFAVLRARLDLDNSQLIKLAIDELYRKHEAKRVLGISDA